MLESKNVRHWPQLTESTCKSGLWDGNRVSPLRCSPGQGHVGPRCPGTARLSRWEGTFCSKPLAFPYTGAVPPLRLLHKMDRPTSDRLTSSAASQLIGFSAARAHTSANIHPRPPAAHACSGLLPARPAHNPGAKTPNLLRFPQHDPSAPGRGLGSVPGAPTGAGCP